MRILFLAACAAAILAGGAAATVAVSDNSLDLAGSTTTASPGVAPARTTEDRTSTTSRTTEDVFGPCDEAEHADDKRCTGAGTTRRDDRHRNRSATTARHDANDDRVTGVDDGQHRGGSNSGAGGSNGSNSGPGGSDDGGSGHGGHRRDHPEDD